VNPAGAPLENRIAPAAVAVPVEFPVTGCS
jgi:hypothetical protein